MTTQPCNLNVSEPLDLPTNAGSTSPKPSTNTAKPQTNAIDASANMPMTSAILAERYSVGDRSVQLWIKRLMEECAIPESVLKENSGNQTTYTAYCVELLDSLNTHRSEGKKVAQWFSLQSQKEPPKTPSFSCSEEDFPEGSLSPVSGGELAVVGAGAMDVHVVPSSKVEVLVNFIESKKPQPLAPVDLNGTAEAGTDRAIALMQHLQQRRERTDAVIGKLYEREQSVSTTEQALEALEVELAEQKALEQAAIQKAYELRNRESEAQDRLGKLEERSQQ